LILGSLPGAASLRAGEYYAHPRNAFWPILGSVLGFDPAAAYGRRVAALERARIAVWDVCRAARRPGSLDSAIARDSVRPNDFRTLFAAHPSFEAVLLNGGTAASLFAKLVVPALAACPERRPLPSTSPAYAGMTFAEKSRRWTEALR
jgi:hypoxanthine-DNA glycosylase